MKTIEEIRRNLKRSLDNPILLAYVGSDERHLGYISMLQQLIDDIETGKKTYYQNGKHYFLGLRDALNWFLGGDNNFEKD